MCSLKEQEQPTALFREQEASLWQSFIAVVDGRKFTPVQENVDKVHSRDSCYNRDPSQRRFWVKHVSRKKLFCILVQWFGQNFQANRLDLGRKRHLAMQVGHFRVSPGLCFKTRVGAQPLIWKSFFILMQIKLIFTRKVAYLASFWKWGSSELGSGLFGSVKAYLKGKGLTSGCNLRWDVLSSQKGRKSADGKGDETFLLASHTKREEGKRDCRLFLLTCVAQKRLCSFGIVCLVHVFANVTVHNVQ